MTLHESYGKSSYSVYDLETFFFSTNSVSEKELPTYNAIFKDLHDAIISPEIVIDSLNRALQRGAAEDLAIAAMQVADGSLPPEALGPLYERFGASGEHSIADEVSPFVTPDLEVLYNETIRTPGLRWRLGFLNQSLGSLRKGDFGFIFARPETGKTTFLASELTYFSGQSDGRPIVWWNNEEQGNKVQLRLYQAALGITLNELIRDRESNQRRFEEAGGTSIKVYDSSAIHRSTVERVVEELKPCLVVFDQLDKIKGFDDDREDLRLGAIYIWARELAKSYAPVIGVCQADGSAEGRKWLNMDNVSNAKTAKQAEADWILGIGKSNDRDLEYVRHLHICKNKLAGDEDTLPELRHGMCDVRIVPQIARYEDIL